MVKSLAIAMVIGLTPAAVWADTAGISLDQPTQESGQPAPKQADSKGLTQLWAQANTDNTANTATNNDEGEAGMTTGYRNIETERWGPQAGDWELTLSGTGSNNNTFSTGAWGVSPSVGYYFNKYIELSGRQTANFGNSQGGSSWSGSTIGALDFNLPLDRFVPFIGMGGGAFYGEHVHAEWVFAPELGLKYYLYPKTFIEGMGSYQWPVDRSFKDDGIFVWTLGLGINF